MQRSALRFLRTAPLLAIALGAVAGLGLSLGTPAGPAFAQDTKCARPRAPEVPNGEKATDVQMVGTNQRMKLYQIAVQTFLECVETQRAAIGTVARDMKLRRLDKQRDEVTTELKATAEKYNDQVRIYKTRKGLVDAPPAEGAGPDPAKPEKASPGAPKAPPGAP